MADARTKEFKQLSFPEVVKYYSKLRSTLYEELNSIYPLHRCGPISSSDAYQADKWRGIDQNKNRYAWRWIDAYSAYNRKSSFKRFDLSIKRGSHIVGLSYGEPTVSKKSLKIDIIESTPYEEHKKDTRVFEIVSRAAQYYGILLGADEVRIMNPLSDDLVNYYCSYGYEYVEPMKRKLGVYCTMKIGV